MNGAVKSLPALLRYLSENAGTLVWRALGLLSLFYEPNIAFYIFFTGNDLRLSMWFVFIQQAQARRWWMGSLKFTIGLSLLSYESRQPEAFADLSSFPLAFRFWSWDVLPDIPPYLILSFHHFIYLSAFDLMIKPFGFFLLLLPFVQDWGFAVPEFW